ncbi:alpha-hydroxy-acid oxidizing protein [Streptomyces lusitanus]|uniref:alpha-hydroxy-acid oxidizing protein n=1 Tax=Streptomyces lusitanus TaxID=68232 RepID=UPI003627DD0C
MADRYGLDPLFEGQRVLRSSSPGTFTEEILRQQVRLMRNNFPRVRIWVKLHPGRDVAAAVRTAVEAGADAVTVDGRGRHRLGARRLPPARRAAARRVPAPARRAPVRPAARRLLVSGRMWEGSRAVKSLALGATAVGLGRAALLAVAEDPPGRPDPPGGMPADRNAAADQLARKVRAGRARPEDVCSPDGWS